MPNRVVVCVATTPYYKQGMMRLAGAIEKQEHAEMIAADHCLTGWPTHAEKPYAFKAYALKEASERNYDTLLWADACMLPVQDMTPLWQRIERDGYWMSRNGWTNYEWTADSAYPDLFPTHFRDLLPGRALESARETNRNIPHVVATCFGISLRHQMGRTFLERYYRLAAETNAFCGPWTNTAHRDWLLSQPHRRTVDKVRESVCGPADVRGHRHDQTAASVIAHGLGFVLTDPPEIFAYGKQGQPFDPRTILIADGSY